MISKDVLIIGGGVSGLSAGIYLQMNGYQTAIYEKHYLPGGVCTGWYKDGFYIDGCIHWLMGTKEGAGYNRMWKELTVLDNVPIYYPEEFLRIKLSNGEDFVIKRDKTIFIEELKRLAPEDENFIDELDQSLNDMAKAEVFFEKPDDIANFFDKLKTFKQLGSSIKVYGKYSKITIGELLESFHSPYLKEVITEIMKMDDFVAISLFTTLNNFFTKNGGIPEGGSLAFAKRLAERYKSLGGELYLRMPVEKMVVDDKHTVTGIELQDGTIVEGKRIVSAADGFITYKQFLQDKYMDSKMKKFYQESKPFKPLLICSYGAADKLEDIPHGVSIPINNGIDIGGGKLEKRLTIRVQNIDHTLNKKKGTVLQVNIFSEWEYWDELYKDRELYDSRKEQLARDVQQAIEEVYPNLIGRIHYIDVATPKTFFHFTNVWNGAFEGWKLTPHNIKMKIPKKITGLSNAYHIGQWTTPGGGIPIAAKDGRNIARILCHEDKKPFLTEQRQ
ncbi:phytoene desaturase family protein [Mesobacillus sp. LC4]